ncbi:PDZ domain-containing protein [Dysgonomonas sp. 511]|uniref:PDZ domain-containing protein n=1 Tax=Dysgonomonas sp. 511 TaxID=2302930 RepID=UPI0013D1AB34|nr:PDZ domain-containing protein [Dysgonomonas sp. 511]NDV77368.1 PDZ domain-containing protein [Dysgonomonas sp. 511]
MRKTLIIILLLSFSATAIKSQGYDKNCYFGFSFEVSQNKNWGFGELIITDVTPNSPAEKAGVKVNDIIMEINGKATYLRDNQTIANWLFDDMYAPTAKFTIRNMNTYFKEYTLNRECIAIGSISERDLSRIFSFYSLEDTNERNFYLPLAIEPDKDVEFTDYHSFDFYLAKGEEVPPIDAKITALLEQELLAKGLVRDTTDPDMLVQVYYSYVPNPRFTALVNPSYSSSTWRYDSDKKRMVELPIFGQNEPNTETAAQFIVEYGFSIYDRKYIDTTKLTQIWDCNITDYLASRYPLDRYVEFHTPLMLKQFPYSNSKIGAEYKVEFNRYNYTGIYYDTENLTTIKDIDAGSPAFEAGLRPGYVIKKIGGKKLDYTKDQLSNGYKHFIAETMSMRDKSTQFANAEGFTECMLWNPAYYSDIAKNFQKSNYFTIFSYLYNFRNYVNINNNDKAITIEAWDGMQNRIFRVTPQIRESVIVKAL